MFEVVRYDRSLKTRWDDFVARSLNGSNIFFRSYMDYHTDRFLDNSLLFIYNSRLEAILPLSRENEIATAHAGLTYGYFVTKKFNFNYELAFRSLISYCRADGIRELIYKPLPAAYQLYENAHEIFFLEKYCFQKTSRGLANGFMITTGYVFPKKKYRGAKQAERNGLCVKKITDPTPIIEVFNTELKRKYNKIAIHSSEELRHLAKENSFIEIFALMMKDVVVGGVVCFWVNNFCCHLQYIALSQEARALRGLDLLMYNLYLSNANNFVTIEFGVSTEDSGRVLNHKLFNAKQEFSNFTTMYSAYKKIIE